MKVKNLDCKIRAGKEAEETFSACSFEEISKMKS